MVSIARKAGALSAALAVIAMAGCATERREFPSREVPRPAWTQRPMDLIGGQRLFVGIALADNVLDEANARQRAMHDAAALLLRTVSMDIEQEFKATERRQGAQYQPGGAADAQRHDVLTAQIGGVVENLRPVDTYMERWFVRENHFQRGFRRYKYFVLAEFVEMEHQEAVEEAKAQVSPAE